MQLSTSVCSLLPCRLYSRLDSRYEPLVAAVEADLLRAFLVTAASAGRADKVADFFKLYGPQLLSSSSGGWAGGGDDGSGAADWRDWFVLPYLQQPEREPRFQVRHIISAVRQHESIAVVTCAWPEAVSGIHYHGTSHSGCWHE
jgi:hypothetical protein